ncbi:inner centromere protein A isoform X4 [Xiphophorus couchianus]|uniref:inner centromere protein A isoform X4 n=1 Tax=Xiphophorus couchianus TaxID=32473 RepID=UPI001015DF8B|nr:inner centromere protein isoform X4 [Xiphophorus couchianus]
MNSVLPSVRSLAEMFVGKTQEFINEIENVHMVWLEEIQQEANRMFSRDFNAEPELMPKTPSQKKNSRRRRVSAGRQEESQARRFSKGKRSNLRGSSVKPFNLIPEEEAISEVSTSKASNPPKPKRATRKNKQTKPEDVDESLSFSDSSKQEDVQNKKQELVKEEDEVDKIQKVNAETKSDNASITSQSPPKIRSAELVVNISAEDRLSAELANKPEASPGRTATKIAIAAADRRSRRSSARCSLKLRHSLAGLRHSMTQESIRRASRRSMLKRMSTRMGTSTSSSSNTGGSSALMESADEDNEEVSKAETEDIVDDLPEKASEASKPESGREVPVPAVERVTRSVAANSPKLAPPPLFCSVVKMSTPAKKSVAAARKQSQATQRSSLSTKRKAPDTEYSPTKRFSPPKKSQSTMKPSMRAFLHTVNKNQMLMMTPSSIGRTAVIKSFIKQATPLKVDPKINMGTVTKERHKLEALRKKQEQEEERMRKMEEEKKKKQEEQKRKREDRIKRVFEAKVKEDLREEEKKKKIEQKMAQIDEKNDKRQAEEKAKKKLAAKRQEELEQKKKLEEEARKKKIQQEEEKRQQELAAKKKAEEEEQQTRKALERQREQELERERQAAAERERVEKEKALALQREVERAAREKEKRELEEQRKALEDKRKLEEQQRLAAKEKALKEREEAKRREAAAAEAQKLLNKTVDLEYSVMKTPAGKGGLNVTVDLQEMSVQSYAITPDGGNKMLTISKNPEDYGMDQNSDDSTDDESAPRKPIPSWAEGANLKQLMGKQYFNPIDVDSIFGPIEPLRLENIFYKSKPRFFKRTSSAVWHSPPTGGK